MTTKDKETQKGRTFTGRTSSKRSQQIDWALFKKIKAASQQQNGHDCIGNKIERQVTCKIMMQIKASDARSASDACKDASKEVIDEVMMQIKSLVS